MKIQGLGYPVAQPKATVKQTQDTQVVTQQREGKGLRPWSQLDEQEVSRLRYDQAGQQQQHAAAYYQDVSNQLRRQEVNELFGVDLYA